VLTFENRSVWNRSAMPAYFIAAVRHIEIATIPMILFVAFFLECLQPFSSYFFIPMIHFVILNDSKI
jgi:hypothetical protein